MSWSAKQYEAHARLQAKQQAEKNARIENLEFLLGVDHNAESVAVRAGYKNAVAAERALIRAGRHDLAARLRQYMGCAVDVYNDHHGIREQVPA